MQPIPRPTTLLFKILIYVLAAMGSIVVVAAVVLAVAYVVVARRLVRKMRDTVGKMENLLAATVEADDFFSPASSQEAIGVPPMRIHVEKTNTPFNDEQESLVERVTEWLSDHSFDFVGDFVIEELATERLRIFLSTDQLLVASIRLPAGVSEPYVEFCFDLGEQRRGGVSNPPLCTLQLPPGAVGRFYRDDLSNHFGLLSQMWLEAKELVDQHNVVKVEQARIPEFYEEAHAAEMDCRIESGGISAQDIRNTFAAQGLEVTDEDVEEVQQRWQEAIENHLLDFSSRGMNHYHSGNHILIVHDGSLQAYLANRIRNMLCDLAPQHPVDENELQQALLNLQELTNRFSPREAIARLRPLLPAAMRYQLVDQLKNPVEADVYRFLPSP